MSFSFYKQFLDNFGILKMWQKNQHFGKKII